jgi:primosomal protein N' (replication factor Y) (superfamily II helicase)
MLYADLILPLPLPGVFTYSVPSLLQEEVSAGKRVLVQFGKRKIYSAVVSRVHDLEPADYATRDILSVLDDGPLVLPVQLDFWNWIATYYMCTPGEVLKAALPSGLKLESETRLVLNPLYTEKDRLGRKEAGVLALLEGRPYSTISELSAAAGGMPVYPVVRTLIEKKAVMAEESVRGSFRPKTGTFISLHPSACNAQELNDITGRLGRAARQLELLYHYLQLSGYSDFSLPAPEIPQGSILKSSKFTHATLKALVTKNILKQSTRYISRIAGPPAEQKGISELNAFQQEALDSIREQFKTKDVVLLDGITSGGKTEIYIHLIKEELKKGRQVLYLLPEIALTAQIIVRLKHIFGNNAGVYHSKFSDPERVEIWNNVLKNDPDGYSLILGVRSSLFLPFSKLGLVIVDEEHENTFKQFEPAPRYHARDAAIMLASMHGAKTLLGTATPSVESAFNALSGKYGLVELVKRYREIELPEIVIADTREARKRKKMRSIFTPELLEAIEQALANSEQVILFQNRRGYAPFMECDDCGWIPRCRQCDVSMTYHKNTSQMVCHYCSATGNPPEACPGCGSTGVKTRGFGTEKIEDEIGIFFPGARVGRLDLDSVRRKRAHEKIISDFESGQLDILAGTQMIAKGLDFGRVSLVGILNADNLLFFPDFRAHERSFQLIFQVSGRAGRKFKRGKVVIQTGFPGHPVIKHITGNNPRQHFREQLAERRQFLYPPYVRLIKITVKDKNRELVEKAAAFLAANLRKKFGSRVLGPEFPLIGRIQNRYIMNILVKIEKRANLPAARALISGEISALQSAPAFRSCQVYPDVDPV